MAVGSWQSAIEERELAVCNWQSAIEERELAVGNWQLAIEERELAVGSRNLESWQSAVGGFSISSLAYCILRLPTADCRLKTIKI